MAALKRARSAATVSVIELTLTHFAGARYILTWRLIPQFQKLLGAL
jgi:hypothetical protein